MGTALKVKCPSCGKQWNHYMGFVFSNVYYYCDKCGKKKTIKYGNEKDGTVVDLSSEYGSCKCSGTFRMNHEPILCPKCHTPAEKNNDVIMMWD